MITRSVIIYKIKTNDLLNEESLTHLIHSYRLEILDIQKEHSIICFTGTYKKIEEITDLLNLYTVVEYSISNEAIMT